MGPFFELAAKIVAEADLPGPSLTVCRGGQTVFAIHQNGETCHWYDEFVISPYMTDAYEYFVGLF